MAFYQKPCLILIYIILFMLSSWVFEWLLLFESGYYTYKLIEPLHNLSVSQLQTLLEGRGIHYSTLIEKTELIDFLEKSGNVQHLELITVSSPSDYSEPIEIFGKDEFYEQVIEETESIWLIEIITSDGERLLDQSTWKQLNKKLKPIGINTAIVKCHKDAGFCFNQDWKHPQLFLSVPRQDSPLKTMQLPSVSLTSTNSIMNWINNQLTKLMERFHNVNELDSTWLNATFVRQSKIPRLLYITELLNPPLLLVTLSLRFSSRIRIAIFSVSQTDKEQVTKIINKYKLSGPPVMVLSSTDGVTSYGNRRGEIMSVDALETYIKLLQPRTNDIFLFSLFLANFFAILDFIDYRGILWKHIMRTMFRFPIYNVFIFISWLTLTAMIKFSWAAPLIDTGLHITQKINSTISGEALYYFLMAQNFYSIILASFILFVSILYVYKKIYGTQHQEDGENDSWYSLFSMDSYLNVLFQPMDSISRPRASNDLGLEEGMQLLIERLATPDLWLQPVVSTEYIPDLPCWRYDGWGNEDDLKSESETDLDSLSDNENDLLIDSHVCCQDDNCNMCTLWSTVKETYVCHRCAILKRKLEKKYLWHRNIGNTARQNSTYETLIKVCENCSRTKRTQTPSVVQAKQINPEKTKTHWFIRLHEIKWTAPKHAIESRVCAICLDRYRWSAVLCGLPCGHTYHHSCIMEWLSKDNHHCPTCRWPSYKMRI